MKSGTLFLLAGIFTILSMMNSLEQTINLGLDTAVYYAGLSILGIVLMRKGIDDINHEDSQRSANSGNK